MMQKTYDEERDIAAQAARRAGQLIRSRTGTRQAETVREKGLNDLVTQTDEEVQSLITSALQDAFPAYTVLAEEDDGADETATVAEQPRWIIDPVDGTTNFTFNAPPFAVSIALQEGAELVVGVVLDVANDVLYTAVRGGGAYRNGTPIRVGTPDTLAHSLIATGFPFRTPENIPDYLDVLGTFIGGTRGVRRAGAAAIDMAKVAEGAYTGYFEAGVNPWDVAAGVVLVREAGGRVTDFAGGEAVIFTRQIIASNGAVHDEMQEAVAPIRTMR